GDRFQVEMVVTAPRLSIVTGPVPDSAGVFAVAEEKRKTELKPDRAIATYRLGMAAFQAGRHRLPTFRFLVTTGDPAHTLSSGSTSVTIASALPAKMDDVHALAPPEPFPNWALWISLAALVLAALGAWAAVRLLRRMREGGLGAQPALPPWEEALEALEAL